MREFCISSINLKIQMTIINIHDISLNFGHKLCFENFSAAIIAGQKIALIGNNGSSIANTERFPTYPRRY